MPQKNTANHTTDFSARITDYVESSGYTVYKLAQITGLGRTAIHQVMSGRLVPAHDFFERLSSAFMITPQQKAELTELYFREKMGSRLYDEQKRLIEMIEKLPQYYIDSTKTLSVGDVSEIGTGAVNGLFNVNRALMELIGRETGRPEPIVCSTVPFSNKAFFELVMQIFGKSSGKAVFEHFIRIYKTGGNTLEHNMDTLENLLKMSMNTGVSYRPYSHYIHEDAVDDIVPIYPYFIVTSEYTALVAADFRSAFITDDAAVMSAASEHIRSLKSNSVLAVEQIDESRMFGIFAESSRAFIKSIEFQPCLSKYLTFDVVKRRLIDIPEKDIIIETLAKNFFTPEQLEFTLTQPAECFYTERGLEYFAETGTMLNMPGHLLEPLSEEERIYILKEMKKDIGGYFKLLNDEKISIPGFIQLILLKNQKCIVSCLMEKKNFCCVLSEQSLFNAFYGLMETLNESELTMPNEKAVQYIDICIEKLESGISEKQ